MEDAVTAIIMAFSVIVFVIALSLFMYLVNIVSYTSENILYVSDRTNYMENIDLKDVSITTRNVDFDTIVPTLYRYYKENFCVKFYDMREESSAPGLIQIFDLTIEGEVRSAASNTGVLTLRDRGLLEAYNKEAKTAYLFQAPWMGNVNKDVKTRVDFFVSGQEGDINNVHVDYTSTRTAGIDNLVEMKEFYDEKPDDYDIVESFVEYNFSGDTITTEDGTETITGDKQAESKIIITYIFKDKVIEGG